MGLATRRSEIFPGRHSPPVRSYTKARGTHMLPTTDEGFYRALKSKNPYSGSVEILRTGIFDRGRAAPRTPRAISGRRHYALHDD
ncbi:hypothetical protein J2129_000033 [Methanofollis sp. W23]|nr:hypothetical protein [Methanofollis sp. W23]